MNNWKLWTCESCQEDYYTTDRWFDECYCRDCYLEKYPAPEWLYDYDEKFETGVNR